jgi:TRAP-type C4-dicarboxylate transport system substrate-binding protein
MSRSPRFALPGLAPLIAIAACVLLVPAPVVARDFRSAEVHPGDYPTTLAVRQMSKLLNEQTKGRLGIKVYPSGSLGTEKTISSS